MNQIDRIRQFNRAITQNLGVLNSNFLGLKRSLGASRVLFEIGEQGADIRQIRDRLGLDSGYMSRLVRGLESEGLVTTQPSPRDRRVRQLFLRQFSV